VRDEFVTDSGWKGECSLRLLRKHVAGESVRVTEDSRR
jgi:hypothetical protein